MTKRRIAGLLSIVLLACLAAPARATTPASEGPLVPGQVLAKFRDGVSASARRVALRSAGARFLGSIPDIDVQILGVPGPVRTTAAALRRTGTVEFAEPNWIRRITAVPNDSCIAGCAVGRQWSLGAVNAAAGWDVFPGRFYTQAEKKALEPIKVAVLDTKIDAGLDDWVNAAAAPSGAPTDAREGGQLDLADAKDFVPPEAQQGGSLYHGSFVAGILGAAANNTAKIAGLGYSAQLMPVTVVDGNGEAKDSDVASGIVWAWRHGARVINLSLGLREYSQTVQNAIYTAALGEPGYPPALLIAAAGNNGATGNGPFYPAQMTGVMAVGATDEADRHSACSNHNSKIAVAAPGDGIVSLHPTMPDGLGVTPCGTSTSTPHVSGLAALLFAQDPTRTPDVVRSIIERSADDVNSAAYPDTAATPKDEYVGHGRINVERALAEGRLLMLAGPQLPVVDQVRASIPRAINGESIVTASGSAVAPKTILDAEWFVDALGVPGGGGQVDAVDGAFDSDTEALSATIRVPLDLSTGVHRLYVRAQDADGWGAASSGALIVDRKAPELRSLTATSAISVLGQGSKITFNVTDDYSSAATFSFAVTRYPVGTGEEVYRSPVLPISSLPASVTTEWRPAITDHGGFTITVTVVDEGLNSARASANVIIL